MPAYQLDNGRWYASFYYRTPSGELKKKYKRSFDTEAEAEAYEKRFLENAGDPSQMTVLELIDSYLAYVRPRIRWSTYDTKALTLRTKVVPFFKNKLAGTVRPLDIVRWQGWLESLRQKNGKPYSATFIRKTNSEVSALFNYAEKQLGLKPNPTKKVKKTGSARADEMLFWTKEEYEHFLDAISDKDISFYAFEILYWTGIREGELLALTPEDFDLDAATLTLSKSFARRNGKDVIGPPKTKMSYRTIVLSDFLVEEIRAWFEYADFAEGERIFPHTKSFLHHEMDRGCLKSGVKRIRIHDLRHSHVSMLIHMGFSAVAIAARMGHESQEITFRYAHLFPDVQDDMANSLQGISDERKKR